MYRKDSLLELYDDIKEFKIKKCLFSPKIVRGAYWNAEKYSGELYTLKNNTDDNYNLAIIKAVELNKNTNYFATHNQRSITLLNNIINNNNNNNNIIMNLMGMNEKYMDSLKINNLQKATYIPYGPYKTMIPYLTRRLYENIDQIKYMNY